MRLLAPGTVGSTTEVLEVPLGLLICGLLAFNFWLLLIGAWLGPGGAVEEVVTVITRPSGRISFILSTLGVALISGVDCFVTFVLRLAGFALFVTGVPRLKGLGLNLPLAVALPAGPGVGLVLFSTPDDLYVDNGVTGRC